MGTYCGDSSPRGRRAVCGGCVKPARLCLCGRVRPPLPLDNVVGVTVLQHALESTHPLNSTRVARLGLKNLAVVPVSDVNLRARFSVRPLPALAEFSTDDSSDPSSRPGKGKSADSSPHCEVVCSSDSIEISIERSINAAIGWVAASPVGKRAVANGFTVRKINCRKMNESEETSEFDEFEALIPARSVLLFPSKASVDLASIDHPVEHLVVLDGTWAKARRMYYENPWLQLLPKVALESGTASLYSEVRHQPKAGCLSTVESIVCAMRLIHGEINGLDQLLALFESMIADQRQCKAEKFKVQSDS